MRKSFLVATVLTISVQSLCQSTKPKFVARDIQNFWLAYDKIISTTDSVLQYQYLKDFYTSKGTAGLKSLIEVRNYTDKEFVAAIVNYPKFWSSIRKNTLNVQELYPEIENDLQKLRNAYPRLRPSIVYFSIGAFRTSGTIQGDRVLIGGELALADQTTVIEELPSWRQPFYSEYEPRKNIALLCTHEYIHTQQKSLVHNLLSMCLYEGIAEFISCKVTGKRSNSPAIAFGRSNQEKIVRQFVADLYIMTNNYNWVWGENRNELKVRDLGYYIGYEIAERYYNLSRDKSKAIQELIELDYANENEVERIVDTTMFLPGTLKNLHAAYEKERPAVVSMIPFQNGSTGVKPGLTKITITFSEPLNGYHDGIDFGPLGQEFCPVINRDKKWSGDGKSWTFEADLKPNKHYQILISNNFRKSNGVRLKPYLIDFRTTD